MDYRWDDAVAKELKDDLDLLVYVSRLLGEDPYLAQSGGGNTSLKRIEKDLAGRDVNTLWVKVIHTSLQDIDRSGFTAIRLDEARLTFQSPAATDEELVAFLSSCRLDPRMGTPTIETPIHLIVPAPWVLHTHDAAIQALTETPRKDTFVREAFGDEVAFVGYARPGVPLDKAIQGVNLGKA